MHIYTIYNIIYETKFVYIWQLSFSLVVFFSAHLFAGREGGAHVDRGDREKSSLGVAGASGRGRRNAHPARVMGEKNQKAANSDADTAASKSMPQQHQLRMYDKSNLQFTRFLSHCC